MGLVHDLGKVVAFQYISQNLTDIKETPNIGNDCFKQALSQCSLGLYSNRNIMAITQRGD